MVIFFLHIFLFRGFFYRFVSFFLWERNIIMNPQQCSWSNLMFICLLCVWAFISSFEIIFCCCCCSSLSLRFISSLFLQCTLLSAHNKVKENEQKWKMKQKTKIPKVKNKRKKNTKKQNLQSTHLQLFYNFILFIKAAAGSMLVSSFYKQNKMYGTKLNDWGKERNEKKTEFVSFIPFLTVCSICVFVALHRFVLCVSTHSLEFESFSLYMHPAYFIHYSLLFYYFLLLLFCIVFFSRYWFTSSSFSIFISFALMVAKTKICVRENVFV